MTPEEIKVGDFVKVTRGAAKRSQIWGRVIELFSPDGDDGEPARSQKVGGSVLIVTVAVLSLAIWFLWTTRGAMTSVLLLFSVGLFLKLLALVGGVWQRWRARPTPEEIDAAHDAAKIDNWLDYYGDPPGAGR